MNGLAVLALDERATSVEAFGDAWTDANDDAAIALRAWRHAPHADAADAYAAYRAALDREDRAAVMLGAATVAQADGGGVA